MIGIPVGFLYANAWEWVIHKYALHGLGKNKRSYWAFHWHEHHRASRQNEHIDPAYERSVFAWNAQSKEALGLLGAGLLHAPLLPVAPFFTASLWTSIALYYHRHKRAHQDPGWAREHLPWHYDHHMGPNQNANWCVTFPWFDHLMGTREPYVGTEREAQDLERAARRREQAAKREAVRAKATAA